MKLLFGIVFFIVSVLAAAQNYSIGLNAGKTCIIAEEYQTSNYIDYYRFNENNSNINCYAINFNKEENNIIMTAGVMYNIKNFDFKFNHDYSVYSMGSGNYSNHSSTDFFYKSRQSELQLHGGYSLVLLSNKVRTSQLMAGVNVMISLYSINKEILDSSVHAYTHTTYSTISDTSYSTTTITYGNSDNVFSIYEKPLTLSAGLSFKHCFKNIIAVKISAEYRILNNIATMYSVDIKSFIFLGVGIQYNLPQRKRSAPGK